MPGNHPKGSIQPSEHGESLKSRKGCCCCCCFSIEFAGRQIDVKRLEGSCVKSGLTNYKKMSVG